MANFPALTPSSRSFTPAVYPQRSFRTLSGALARRTFGSSPYGAKLDLQYTNIADAAVNTLLDHYHSQTAANKRFRLSANTTAGMSSDVAGEVTSLAAARGNLRWEYAEPPKVESVRPGVYNVAISLAGEIRDPRTDDA
jgi:hypothetical protein